ncbi:hypothetical protein G7074_14500 [Pedobacter sp. HDW13]|uniref:STN domain-containing protein n=1 Tax=Pedobacter sp. HDW13 TaxID=2714940 RepID=UPI00140AF63E|nr:STN domain-containing protein [Pedobacter sp. HDW13]QIL40364.1 hypothetical protein G7074_14500 [Pedobacter sp. HDW13]
MKLTTILFFLFSLGVHASGRAQQITLTLKNTSLKVVFQEVEKQTSYAFLYNDELLLKVKPVTLQVKNASIEEVLNLAFMGKPLSYKLRNKTITIVEKKNEEVVNVADFSLNGEVVDEAGKPVPG